MKKKKKKLTLALLETPNINLFVVVLNKSKIKRERERERKCKHDGSSGGIIHFRTKSFLKLGEHPSRSPGLPALTRKLINGPIHIPFPSPFFSLSPRQPAENRVAVSRSNRGMARYFFLFFASLHR